MKTPHKKEKQTKTLGVYMSLILLLHFSPIFLRIWFRFVSILKQESHKNISSWLQESSGGDAEYAVIMDPVVELPWKYCACYD